LEEQRKRQKETVHELKTKTKFTRVKNLLETYGDERPSAAGLVQRPGSQPPARPNQPPVRLNQPSPSQFSAQPPQFNQSVQPSKLVKSGSQVSLQKQWYDKVFDAIIGPVESANSKYALICTRCFTHNGLVLPDEYATTRKRESRVGLTFRIPMSQVWILE